MKQISDNGLNYKKQKGLLPTIIQEDKTGDVLMLGYMNDVSLRKTQETGLVHFWSRKRKNLWKKGETSGNLLKVKKIITDCDKDALLINVELVGKATCHTGNKSCFHKTL